MIKKQDHVGEGADEPYSIGKTSAKQSYDFGETSVIQSYGIGDASVEQQGSIGDTPEKYLQKKEKISECTGVWNTLNATQQVILGLLSENSKLTGTELAEKVGISKRNIESNMKKLKEKGLLVRHGSPKSGYWEILRK